MCQHSVTQCVFLLDQGAEAWTWPLTFIYYEWVELYLCPNNRPFWHAQGEFYLNDVLEITLPIACRENPCSGLTRFAQLKSPLHTLSIHPGLTVQIEVAHLKTMQYKPKMMTVTWPESYLS